MRPDLKVEVPAEDSGSPTDRGSGDDELSSSGKWGKYSPGALVSKTASFTAKLAKGTVNTMNPSSMRSGSKRVGRQSVDPNKRAAIDAEYRSATMLHDADKQGKQVGCSNILDYTDLVQCTLFPEIWAWKCMHNKNHCIPLG